MSVYRSSRLRKGAPAAAFVCCLAGFPMFAQGDELPTKSGSEVGVSVSGYKYDEPGLAAIKATKIGFDYSGTYALDSQFPSRNKGWFLRGDARYATGKADYSSPISGTINNRPDWYYEVRGLVGKDFFLGEYTLSPYAGLGYRYLFNDIRGVSSTGAAGYRRESNYFTLPVGVTHKMALSNQSKLLSTVEFSYLLRGRQESKLSDASPANADVSNRQRNGYGLRLGAMVQFPTWSVGPSLVVWRIKESDRVGPTAVFEPRNNTVEFGLKAAYSF